MSCSNSAVTASGMINIAEARDEIGVPEAVQRLIRLGHLGQSLERPGVEVSAGVMRFQRIDLSVRSGLSR